MLLKTSLKDVGALRIFRIYVVRLVIYLQDKCMMITPNYILYFNILPSHLGSKIKKGGLKEENRDAAKI